MQQRLVMGGKFVKCKIEKNVESINDIVLIKEHVNPFVKKNIKNISINLSNSKIWLKIHSQYDRK